MAEPPLKCRRGHWFSDANTILTRNGRGQIVRECRTCKQARERAYSRRNRATITATSLAGRELAQTRGLDPADPRHGTINGYVYWGCRCGECRAANATATRVRLLKRKALKLGVLPKERNQVRSLRSLDAVAEARYGMDRILTGSVWGDPTADEALAG